MTELNMDRATCEEQITDLVLEMLDEASDYMSFVYDSWKFRLV